MDKPRVIKAEIASFVMMIIASALVFASVFVDYKSLYPAVKILSYASSLLFWIALISAWAIQLFLLKHVNGQEKSASKPALITFFSNRYAVAADIAMVLTAILILIGIVAGIPDIIKTAFVSVFIFAFQMHIALNGRVYKYING